ncbi:hypothetical protein [Nocardia sp. NPDC127526]|uniref:hypothetical protein n=1 Tax=Nocardia sp. NPDC127526 TaxID=3345393 RepID=UPI003629B0ED
MPVDEVVIRWSTTEQFEMRVSRAALVEMLAENDELPNNLDELDDSEISYLFDSEELANDEGNEDGHYIGTIERSIDSVEIVRPIPEQYTHFAPGQQIRIVRDILTPDGVDEEGRIEWTSTIVQLDGSGVLVRENDHYIHLSWASKDPDIRMSFTAVDAETPVGTSLR